MWLSSFFIEVYQVNLIRYLVSVNYVSARVIMRNLLTERMLIEAPPIDEMWRCKRMNKRWTIGKIKEFVESNSESKLLSMEYQGFSQRLQFECACGSHFEKTFTKFKDKNQRKCDVCQPPKASR